MVNAKPDVRPDLKSDPNIRTYNSSAVAEYYAALDYLSPCERLVFDEYLRPGMSMLDLGVGGGRTTPYLSSVARRYVGVDYASEMIAACRKKFPQLEFEVASAADLSRFAPSTFDAVVMAFNALDYVFPSESRLRALKEIHRVLNPGGILIFSSHNPRAICVRPSWHPKPVREVAESIVRSDSVLFPLVLSTLTAARVVLAGLQAVLKSIGRIARRLPTPAFWRGEGYWMDPVHGGLKTHAAVPERVAEELGRFGFRSLRVLGDDYPRPSHPYVTDWYYYVFSKSKATGEK
jgi:ubiquinone/menaquinone biosynthesis C-methylase UbiE